MKREKKSRHRALLVTNRPLVERTEAATLVICGFHVDIVSSGRQAIEKMNNTPVDIVVIDLNPVKEAFALALGREIAKKNNIPFMFLVEKADASTLAKIAAVESAGCAVRNFSPLFMSACIATCLSLFRLAKTKASQAREIHAVSGEFLKNLVKLKKSHEGHAGAKQQVIDREKSLKESSARYHELFEGAQDGIVIIDADSGRVLEVNNEAARLFRSTKKKLIGTHITELFPEKKEFHLEKYKKLMAAGKRFVSPVHIMTADGKKIPIEVSSSMIALSSGQRLIQGIFRDITERLAAEEALKKSGEYQRLIIKNAPFGSYFYHLETNGRLVFDNANPAADRILGLDHKTLFGKVIEEAFPALVGTEIPAKYKKIAEKGGSFDWDQVNYHEGEISGAFEVHTFQPSPGRLAVFFTDITERRQAEDTLAKTEARFRLFMDTFPGLAYIKDSDLRVVFVNKGFANYLNLDPVAIVGKTNAEIFPPDFANTITRDDQEVLQNGESKTTEEYFSNRHWETYKFVIPQTGADPLLGGFTIDISRRKLFQESLQNSEKKFATAFSLSPEPMAISEVASGRLIDVNKAFEQWSGFSRNELIGHTAIELDIWVNPQDREGLVRSLLEGNAVEGELVRFRIKNGEIRDVLFSTTIISIEGKDLLLSIDHDITERLKAERASNESEERYRLLFETNPLPMWVFDLETLKFLAVNDATVKHYGYSREEFLSMFIQDIRPPEEIPRLMENLKLIRQGIDQPGVWRHRKKDGTLIDVEITSHTLEHTGGRTRMVLAHDVTARLRAEEERQRLQAQLLQAQKMESVGRLAGGMAHDFNNLLTVILGSCELMRVENLPADSIVLSCIGQIQKAGERAKNLTKQLLAFSRKQILEMKTVDLNGVIADFEKILQRLLGEDITVIATLDPALWPVNADAAQIEQVIMNLAVNARDSMEGGGRLTIRTANIRLTETLSEYHAVIKPGDYVVLSMSDTGSGMDSETLKHMFEPFFTTKEVGKGTGLGLAMVYGIIQQHAGHVWLYSEKGRGTTFKIYLPRVRDEEIVGEPEKPDEFLLSGSETILVVEDETMIRTMICTTLTAYGYTVIEAEDSHDAIQKGCRAQHVDLLLTDLIMPELNGRQVFEKIAECKPDIKVLYMSGYADDVISFHGILQEGVHLIQKPFLPSALAKKLRDLLDEK